MSTLTRADVSRMSQTIDRALRHLHHSRQLSAAQQRGDMAAQLEHSLHVADTRMELISLRDELTRRAQAEGLRLDDPGRFVPAA